MNYLIAIYLLLLIIGLFIYLFFRFWQAISDSMEDNGGTEIEEVDVYSYDEELTRL